MESRWTTPAQVLAYSAYALLRAIRSAAYRLHLNSDFHSRCIRIRIQPPATAQSRVPRIIRLVQEMTRAGDLILIDLRIALELQGARAGTIDLPVSSEELVLALGSLPLQRAVKICVASSDCIFLLDRRSCMRVSGPSNGLSEILARLEAA